MAKSKKTKKQAKPSNETWRRVKKFLSSDEFRKFCGVFWVIFALVLFYSIIAVCFHFDNNWFRRVGVGLGTFATKNTFGFSSLGFTLIAFVYGLRLLEKQILPWQKTLFSTLFWMAWVSCLFGYIDVQWVSGPDGLDDSLELFEGVFGRFVARGLFGFLGIGLPILLVLSAGAFLIFVHHVKMPEIKLPERIQEDDDEEDEDVVEAKSRPSFFSRIFGKEEDDDDEEDAEIVPAEPQPEKKSRKKKEEPSAPVSAPVFTVNDPDSEDNGLEIIDDTAEEEIPEPVLVSNDPEAAPAENDVTKFDIDEQFARVTQKAMGGAEPSFTVVETESSDIDGDGNPDKGAEELAPDDYRQFYGMENDPYDPHLDLKDFQMPSTDILEDWEKRNVKVTKDELIANKDHIVETLRNYGIEIVEISASPGPTVTLYEIKPAPGVRISRIKSLEDDIALSLAALGIRIIAPIPGKGTVGIEVPNANPQIVSMKTMLTSDAFANNTKFELPIAFGKTISNEPYVTDLAKMPHLLMAGATGTGKSVGLNAVIASLLYKKHPTELKFVMVDPKKVELSLYNKIERHYLAKLPDSDEAIITDVKKVVRTLNSLCIEMDQRYDLLKQAQVRKIKEYNEKFINRQLNPNNGHRYLPYIVLIIDEFADLIMTAGKEVETPICRLAQLARAVGIHLIIATQRPTTNIITGTIKANFPARVAFKVTSAIDSRTILDTSGAQRLIGRGDMLISLSGSDLIRLQCALMETEECDRLADFIGQQRGYAEGEGFQLPEYLDENEEPNKDFDPKAKDEFFNDAARLIVANQFGSTSLIQRKMQLGYNRAGRIIDQLEAAGIVGPYNGSKARDVLIKDENTLEELLRSL